MCTNPQIVFGFSLTDLGDLDGDGITDLGVGAWNDDDGGDSRGAAYVLFLNADGTVKSHQKISDTEGNFTAALDDTDNFGSALTDIGDLDGDGITDLVVGQWQDDDRGAVYVLFLNADGTVKSHQKISDTEGNFEGVLDNNDSFGISAANLGDLDGDGVNDLAVGAWSDDDGGTHLGADRGAVYILSLAGVTPPGVVTSFTKISDTEGNFTAVLDGGDNLGYTATELGDLDGDGINDMAVGSPGDDDGGFNRGAVYVLFLNANGTVKSHQKISDIEGNFITTLDDFDEFGGALASLGDLDDDGITDLAVGASKDDDGGGGHGAVYVLFLNANGTVKSHQKISDTAGNFTATLNDGNSFGGSVASLGDLDGDGITDMAVGAWEDDDGGHDHGAVFVLFMDAGGTVKSHQKISDTEGNLSFTLDDDDQFGRSMTSLGDFNGDGFTDLTVGAWGDSDGGSHRGAVYVLFLNSDGTVRAHQKISNTEGNFTGALDNDDLFGFGLTTLSDLDGDDVSELVAGAIFDDDGGTDRGAAYVLFLNADATVKAHQKISDTEGNFVATLDDDDRFGWSLANLGDINGDGVAELAVGAPQDDDSGSDSGSQWGAVYILSLAGAQGVQQPTPVIIDNGDAVGYSSTGFHAIPDALFPTPEGRDGDIENSQKGTGADVATWTFSGLTPGRAYRVSATWSTHENRATDAPYSIIDGASGTLLKQTLVNQEQAPDDFTADGSDWEDLGIVTITGDTLIVELSDAADQYVIADAVRIVELTTAPATDGALYLDDGDAGYSDSGWSVTPVLEGRLNDIRYQPKGTGSETAAWTFTGLTPGNYTIAATWSPHANRATNAPFTIYDGAGGDMLEVIRVDQEQAPADFNANGSDWHELTIVTISGSELVVELSNDADQYVIADAVRIAPTTDEPPLPPGTIIDDGDAAFSTTTGWAASLTEGRDGDIHYTAPGNGSRIATWTFTGLTAGTYRVSATWSAHANRATDAPYTLYDGATSVGTVAINQQQAPDDFTTQGSSWEDLMEVEITGDALVVELSNNANGFVIADAIRIQPVN